MSLSVTSRSEVKVTVVESKDPGLEPLLSGKDFEDLTTKLPKEVLTEFSQGEFYGHGLAYKGSECDTPELKVKKLESKSLPAGLAPTLKWIKTTNKLRIMFKGT